MGASELLSKLFETDFMPHVLCLRTPGVVWLHAFSDGLTGLAYFLIPFGLHRLVRRRSDLAYHWLFLLFAAFILSCGATHILGIITLWIPIYRFEGVVKAVTALSSLPTAILLIHLVPKIAQLPSLAQWQTSNQELTIEISQRRSAELALASLNAELELRVQERTLELEEKNAKLRELTSAWDLARGLIRGADGRITFWCHGSEQLYGWTKAEAVGQIAQQLLNTQFHGAESEIESELLVNGSWHGELVHQTKAGVKISVATHWILQRSANNQVSVIEINHDISDRLRAEETAQRLAAIVESSPDAIIGADLQGVINSWNRSAEVLFGYPADEAIGRSVEVLVPERLIEDQRKTRERSKKGRYAKLDETFRLTKGGREIPVAVTVSPVLNSSNSVIGISKTVHDISEAKAREEVLRKLEDQLQQAQKMETIGRLAGGIAHDFNNLLTVINGYSQLLLDGFGNNDRIGTALRTVLQAGERAARLTAQLLAFSRKQVLQPKIFTINSMLESMMPILPSLIREDIEIAWNLQADVGLVSLDPSQFEQVIMNLAVNARDAMPHGGCLSVELEKRYLGEAQIDPEMSPGNYAVIRVSDTGEGMSSQVMERIFDPFFTTKERGQGTGLGLATVYGIVKQSAGSINVSSQLGKGSQFQIYFPLVEGSSMIMQDDIKQFADLRGNETILLVEDDTNVREYANAVLQQAGYRVLVASNGPAAILESERFSSDIELLLTDVVMPKLNGLDLAEFIAGQRPGIAVLFVSGHAEDAIVRRGISEDQLNFLSKPFSAVELLRKIKLVLSTATRTKTVLIADDDEGIRELFTTALQRAGYEALRCKNGREAVTQLRGNRVDLLITDLVMPDQEGVETITSVKTEFPNLKVLAVSGYGEYLHMARLIGADEALEKPVDLNDLCKKVKSMIG